MTKRRTTTRKAKQQPAPSPPPVYVATPADRLCVIDHGFDQAGGRNLVAALPDGRLCSRHRANLDDWASEIPAMWFKLAFALEPAAGGSSDGGSRSHSPHSPAPIDLVVAALRDARNPTARTTGGDVPSVLGVVASWVMVLADRRPLKTFTRDHIGWRIYPDGSREKRFGPLYGLMPRSMLGQLALLRSHHDWIADQPFVGAYHAQLGQIHAALVDKVGVPVLSGSTRSRATRLAQAVVTK